MLKIHPDRNDELDTVMAKFSSISSHSEKLNRWCRWLAAKQSAELSGLGDLAKALENKSFDHKMAESNAQTALCIWLAPLLIDASQTLVQFSGASHESMINAFRNLDQEVSVTSAEYIAARAAGNLPDRNAKDAPPEYGVLARELTKKTRHKPVRWLVKEMGSSLTDLMPCFMMSPLSVAQFLPADFSMFDLVIFDEASQITTWDAVGAIARGKNVIVVGDPKQMPPSNAFGRADADDPDEADMESILDQALAARLPHLRLTGHYRSRHETLIAFSNSHYYENSLMTFPSAETKKSAVTLCRVDGVYAKGKSKTNAIEAKAVVNEVVARLQVMLATEEIKSIGIVTINSQQQRLVEDLMDGARRSNPELEIFFKATDNYDPIFVKNLESVQGDERDIIILSLTYGPTELGSRTMSMNFGPLNKVGGERRLNVAITRATTEMLVFSSFDASMIDLSRTQSTAIEHLKNYIEFAERGPVALAEYSHANYGVDQFDSDFEQSVATSLRAKGWKVQTQVGVSKFRVDLGVIHPDHPGKYLAGIECDGATYHSSPSARDRDRVRQMILENLGWRILRLWSTDYFQDSEYAMSKLFEQLDSILAAERKADESRVEQEQVGEVAESIELVEATEAVSEVDEKDSESISELSEENVDANISMQTAKILPMLPIYDKGVLFLDSHRDNISELSRLIFSVKNGITLNELSQDIAYQHGLKKSSRKQLKYILDVIKPWVGITRDGINRPTVWLRPEDVVDEIAWRGLAPFGEERNWKDLAYQEEIGFARAAIQAQSYDPIDWMFKELQLSRRHEATSSQFQEWLDYVGQA